MTTKIKYTGFSHFRELLENDFKKLGVEGQEALSFARHEVVEVADETANAIMEVLGDEFEKVEEDVKEAKSTKRTDKTSSTSGSTNASGPA